MRTTYEIGTIFIKSRYRKCIVFEGESKSMAFENDNHILTDISNENNQKQQQQQQKKNLAK